MASGATATAGAQAPAASTGGGSVPFWYGSNIYARKFNTSSYLLGANTFPYEQNIPPQGYMSAVRMQVRSAGAVGGTLAADGVATVFNSMELDDVDGANICYPMGGFAYQAGNTYSRPWDGDLTRRFDYAASINPSFSISLKPELRHTAGVLANTDARSQYKQAYTVATSAAVYSVAPGTAATVTITSYLEVWAQPDARDLKGNPIDPIPPGLALATKRRHQVGTLNATGADNTMQLSLTGNEIRLALLVTRDTTNARVAGLSDPINVMLDNKNLGVFSPDELFNLDNDFYEFLQNGTSNLPTGVYPFPRFFDPGRLVGQAWMGTTNATYLVFEATSQNAASGGTWEIIVDEAVPVGPLDMSLESI